MLLERFHYILETRQAAFLQVLEFCSAGFAVSSPVSRKKKANSIAPSVLVPFL